MAEIKEYVGDFTPKEATFGIVVARFNEFVVDALLSGAIDQLRRHGVDNARIEILRVPGAYEIPFTANLMAESKKYNAIIALGAVIRGSTPHFDIVAGESAKGLSNVSAHHGLPVINGIITTETIEQAIERSGTKAGNKGAEAAVVAIEMVSLISKFK
ncbi:MAG: 6,7-dimethyl-8-ribityllumazine synthase [Cocleimonas sp.]|nr:6,7-dimethyl-8-ribityllumazine synthase [Cocleimonas sp.]